MSEQAKKVYDYLNNLGILYEVIEHPPVFTCEEMEQYVSHLTGAHCKNLLLRNKKGNRHILVIIEESKQIKIKDFGKGIGVSNLSFASEERLLKYMGVTTGAVSVFGLINDTEHAVEVYIDQAVLSKKEVNFHPNDNTATVHLTTKDMLRFLNACENKVWSFNENNQSIPLS